MAAIGTLPAQWVSPVSERAHISYSLRTFADSGILELRLQDGSTVALIPAIYFDGASIGTSAAYAELNWVG